MKGHVACPIIIQLACFFFSFLKFSKCPDISLAPPFWLASILARRHWTCDSPVQEWDLRGHCRRRIALVEGKAVCWETGLRVGKAGGPLEKEPGETVVLCVLAGKGAAASPSEETSGGGDCPSLPGLQGFNCKLQGFKCVIPKVFKAYSTLPH